MVSEFKKKQKSKIPHEKIMLIFGMVLSLVILYFLIYANIKINQKKQELKLQLENLKQQTQELENSNNTLQEGIQNVSNPNYIEKIAREQLGLQKDSENTTVFLIPKSENNETKNTNTDKDGWFANLWQSIKTFFE